MVRPVFGGARKPALDARDNLGEDAEIDVISEDGVAPVDDNAERRCQRQKKRPDQRIIPARVQRDGGGLCDCGGCGGGSPGGRFGNGAGL